MAYNTCGYFATCVVIRAWAKCPHVLYAKPSNRRVITPLPKNCCFTIGFYFFGKSIQKHPDSVCENVVNNEKNVRAYYIQTIEWEVNYCTEKKSCFGFYFLVRVSTKNPDCVCHSCSFCIHRYSPCLNLQDTTAYYGLTFCTFPWPYVVKWHNSGIINSRNAISKSNLVFLCRDSSILLKKMFNYPIKFHNTTITLR